MAWDSRRRAREEDTVDSAHVAGWDQTVSALERRIRSRQDKSSGNIADYSDAGKGFGGAGMREVHDVD